MCQDKTTGRGESAYLNNMNILWCLYKFMCVKRIKQIGVEKLLVGCQTNRFTLEHIPIYRQADN